MPIHCDLKVFPSGDTPSHPDNGGKARYFTSYGFTLQNGQAFAEALCQQAIITPVATSIQSPHGQKFIVDGPISTPSGKIAFVRTIWIVDLGEDAPRLVTAYPYEGSE
jgi:hypothetical protein